MKSSISIRKQVFQQTLSLVSAILAAILIGLLLLAIDGFFDLSALLLFLAVVLDVFDGKIAGLMHQKNLFGKQIDSMSDLVSFGVAPALLFYSLSSPGTLGIIVALLFVACGMLRLARYNISEEAGFEGVPITVNGVLFPVLFLLFSSFPESLNYWPVIFLIQSFLMISTFKVSRIF